MRVSVSQETSVPLEAAWRWWTDFGKAGEEVVLDHGMGKSRRRIVEADGKRVVMEETLPLPGTAKVKLQRHEVVLHDGHRFTERALDGPQFDAEWRFEPTTSGGTRITRDFHLPSKPVDWTGKLGEKAARAMIERDLKAHVREMERERPT